LATILVFVRWGLKLQTFLRKEHLNALGKLVMVAGLSWLYVWFATLIVEWYGDEPIIGELLHDEFYGEMRPFFFMMMACNLIPIVAFMFKRVRTTPILLLLFALMVNVGMYTERVLIVVGNLERNYMPFNWGEYRPSWVEISIVAMTFAGFTLFYLLFSRIFPYVPVWEIKEGRLRYTLRRIGRLLIPTAAEIE